MGTQIQQLSRPKHNHLRDLNRRSVYWLDKMPPEKTESTTKIGSLPYGRSANGLSGPSHLNGYVNWLNLDPLQEGGSPAALCQHLCTQTAVASSRIRQLAQPKRQQIQVVSSFRFEPRPMTQLASRTSAHIDLLATPKHDHPKYEGERPVCWPVSKAARHHVASQRLCELSCPKSRKALFEGYDPYVVSRTARSANPSTRIQELSLPLPRKCSSKE